MLKFILYPMLLLAAMPGHTNLAFLKSTSSSAKHMDHMVPGKIAGSTINTTAEAKGGLYNLWQLDNQGISRKAFACAMKGLDYLSRTGMVAKRNIISIVDFSRPSTQKRLFVIDMATGKVLFKTWVAHGQNSGDAYARNFSNSMESHQSSLGFYITMGTYIGGNGYSLR